MEHYLQKFFGYSTFRPHQKEVIAEILQGRDCLVLMATGGGKSICYQLPALISKKTAVVISPLYSLMQDQVTSLQQRGIRAEFMGSAQKDGTVQSRAEDGKIDVLYMTPEKACSVSERFWSALMCRGVSLLAVDEAHCISEWGHEFRTEFRSLCGLRRYLPDVPVVALTATATHKVREDIVQSLHLQDVHVALSSFDRPNIFYGAKCLPNRSAFMEELKKELTGEEHDVGHHGSTIIYCMTVKIVEKVVKELRSLNLNACAYHAQMPQRLRTEVHRAFSTDELQIVVATIAFGMGIDKQNVRQVIHYGCPRSLEAYYQESGRCGRDGRPSQCWLYHSRNDFMKTELYSAKSPNENRKVEVKEAYATALRYCSTVACRRRIILEYFDETVSSENCGNCDNCLRAASDQSSNTSKEAGLLISAVMSCGQNFGLRLPIDVLRGSLGRKVLENGFNNLPVHGQGRQKSVFWWYSLGDQLLANGYFEFVFRKSFKIIRVTAKGIQYLELTTSQTLKKCNEMPQEKQKQRELESPLVSENEVVDTPEFANTSCQMVQQVEISEAASAARKQSPMVPKVKSLRSTIARRKRNFLFLNELKDNADIAGTSSTGIPSVNMATQMSTSSINLKPSEVPLHSNISKSNGLYILCFETQEITNDPELLKSPSSLMVALNELEMKDQLYERIGRAYGMWTLAAPVESPRCEPEVDCVRKTVESFRKQATGMPNEVARASELLQFREYLEMMSCVPTLVYSRKKPSLKMN